MSRTETITIRNRRRYRVNISRVVDEAPEVGQRMFAVAPNERRRTQQGNLVGRLHDGGSRISTAPRNGIDETDLVNRFVANHYEAGPFPTISQIDVVRRELAARAELPPVAYEHSGRLSYGNFVPMGATDETDGVAMGLYLERRKFADSDPQIKTSFGVNHLSSWIHAMRSPTEQLTSFLAGDGTDEIRQRIERLQLEGFSSDTVARAQRDLAFIPDRLSPGMYCPSFTGGQVYHSFDPLDLTNYHCTNVPSSSGPAVTPWMPVGEGLGSAFDVIAEPKLFRIMFTWVAVYVVIVLFAPPILVAEVNIGAYSDRLPFGYIYREEPEQSINDSFVSQWISESNRFALAINQDLGAQSFGRFFFKALVGRVDGLWEVWRPAQNVGDLAGILDVRRGGFGSRRDRHWIYRKTAVPGGLTIPAGIQGYGSLNLGGLVQGHNKVRPTFAGGREYGPF